MSLSGGRLGNDTLSHLGRDLLGVDACWYGNEDVGKRSLEVDVGGPKHTLLVDDD